MSKSRRFEKESSNIVKQSLLERFGKNFQSSFTLKELVKDQHKEIKIARKNGASWQDIATFYEEKYPGQSIGPQSLRQYYSQFSAKSKAAKRDRKRGKDIVKTQHRSNQSVDIQQAEVSTLLPVTSNPQTADDPADESDLTASSEAIIWSGEKQLSSTLPSCDRQSDTSGANAVQASVTQDDVSIPPFVNDQSSLPIEQPQQPDIQATSSQLPAETISEAAKPLPVNQPANDSTRKKKDRFANAFVERY